MAQYVDGYVVPLPKRKLDEYKKIARKCSKIWKEHGALEYVECISDDVKPGKQTSFPQSVKLKKGEVIIFAYVVYKSRAHRDRVNKKAMNDERIKEFGPDNVPFDCKRMIWGGFKSIITA